MALDKNCISRVSATLRREVNQGGNEIRNEAVLNLTGRILHRQSGRAASSVFVQVRPYPGGVKLLIGSDVGYLRIWELTGHRAFTIHPKKAKALAIPVFRMLPGQRGGAGLARQISASVGSRVVFGLRTPGQRQRTGARTAFMFRKSVKIPAAAPKPWLQPAVHDRIGPVSRNVMNAVVDEFLACFPPRIGGRR